MLPILQGYVMKTVGVTQMPVRYEAPLVLSQIFYRDLDRPGEYDGGGPAVATRSAHC